MTKELLCEVLDIPPFLNHDDQFIVDDNYIVLSWGGEIHDEINIYELAHKCKKWLWSKGYDIETFERRNGLVTSTLIWGMYSDFEKDFYAKKHTEIDLEPSVEIVFRYCQWVLENKENKND